MIHDSPLTIKNRVFSQRLGPWWGLRESLSGRRVVGAQGFPGEESRSGKLGGLLRVFVGVPEAYPRPARWPISSPEVL